MPTTASTPSANAGAAPVTAGTRVLVADKLETSAIEIDRSELMNVFLRKTIFGASPGAAQNP